MNGWMDEQMEEQMTEKNKLIYDMKSKELKGQQALCTHQMSKVRGQVLLLKSDIPQVCVVDPNDAVILLKQTLDISLPSTLQTLHQQTQRPAAHTHTQTLDLEISEIYYLFSHKRHPFEMKH